MTAFAVAGVGIVVIAYGIAQDWQRQGAFPWHMLRFALVGPVFGLLLIPFILWIISARQVALSNESAITRVKGGKTSRHWREVTFVLKEENYIAICSGTLDALVIPCRAFPGRAEASTFYKTALQFWREAKGLLPPPVPDTTCVWLPAPRGGNSAEPGDAPQC